MKKIAEWGKRISLFLFGIALVVWGYKVNAANNAKIKEAEKAQKEKVTPPESIFGSIDPNENNTKKEEKVSGNETVIESDKTVEESSATE